MKKKLISCAVAAMTMAAAVSAFAANPTVVLDERVISFADQPAVISEDGRTLVPARGVFENMGARVDWYESDRSIAVVSADSLTKVVLKIDDSTMKVRHFTDLINYTEEVFTLDTPPQIMNDRTMIPLRAVSEAFNCDVQWDADNYRVSITTAEYAAIIGKSDAAGSDTAVPVEDTRVKMSISVDKEDVNAGDEVTVFVNASNIPADKELTFTSATARVFYDNTKFEFVSFGTGLENENAEILGGANGEYRNNSVKSAYVMMTRDEKLKDGVVTVLKFKALTDEGGEFTLSNEIDTKRGADTSVGGVDAENNSYNFDEAKNLNIDTTPVVVK